MGAMLLKQDRIEESILHSTEAIRIYPHHTKALTNLGIALSKAGRTDEALRCFEKVLKIKPDADAHINFAGALATKGDFAEAVLHYRTALETTDIIPLHRALGYALFNLGRFEEAVEEYRKALSAMPNDPNVLNSLGITLFEQGKFDDAVGHLTEALRLNPQFAQAHYYLGKALLQKGKTSEAVTHFEEAFRLSPDSFDVMNDLAWLLAASKETTIHNPDRAIKLAQRACELTDYKEPDLLDTLAAAYAAAGDFSKAIETAKKALELCQSPEQNTLKEEIEGRLVLYKAGKPYIETP
jgi:Flp pilus assembly protein TadD